ncbi:MAG TPA: AMP-binding protein, partial [Thermoanaerobaculia bacterium]|nr:AMP-binding protein [Thermoanaerobaculia bacterium]
MSEATVIERFGASLERDPDATAITLIASGGHAERLTYAGLFDMARRAASGLESLALRRGGVVVLSMPASKEILAYYLACLGTGVIPLIASGSHRANAFPSAPVLTLDGARDRMALGEKDIELRADPDGIAHLQSTSGSTGVPKTAVIRHRNVSANVRAIGQAIGERDGDSVVSWLPLYHDMGLICVSCVLFWQRPFVLTDAANFVRHPIRYWLQLISTFRATISPAPASAYQVCARLAKRRSFEELDLSTWRVGFCGAEPVHPRTVTDFQERFAPYGLPPTTLLPVYGLAEATLAVTIPERDSR